MSDSNAELSVKKYLDNPRTEEMLAGVLTDEHARKALLRAALLSLKSNSELAKCTTKSWTRALLDSAELRITPGLLGRGYFVPRRNNKAPGRPLEVSFDPGAGGMIEIAYRTNMVKRIEAHAVHRGEHFEYCCDPFTRLKYIPNMGKKREPVVAAFAAFELMTGGLVIEVLDEYDLTKIRELGFGGPSGPWAKWESQMAEKSAIRRGFKRIPHNENPEFIRMLSLVDRADGFDTIEAKGESSDEPAQEAAPVNVKALPAPLPTAQQTDVRRRTNELSRKLKEKMASGDVIKVNPAVDAAPPSHDHDGVVPDDYFPVSESTPNMESI